MFSRKTVEKIVALLVSDPGVSAAEREAVYRALEQGQAKTVVANVRIVKFADAAGRLGVSVGTVRNMVRRGRLKAAYGSSHKAIGVREESLMDV